jgi:predicted metal-dependent hydrolase
MTKNKQLSELLNTACEIIADLEDFYYNFDHDDCSMQERLDDFFNKVNALQEDNNTARDGDDEAQDYGVWGSDKI